MKFGIIVFPGSNCDRDMHDALKYDLSQEVIMLWHKDTDLSLFNTEDCIVLPGGFSYGDYLRCGAIARFSPMMQSVIEFAAKGGNVFGVCNGFQILCESHLLPGVLLRNANQQFIGKNIYVQGQTAAEKSFHADEDRMLPNPSTLSSISFKEIYGELPRQICTLFAPNVKSIAYLMTR